MFDLEFRSACPRLEVVAVQRGGRAEASASGRSAHCSAGPAVRIENAVLDDGYASHDQVANARGELGRFLVRRAIGDRCRIEDDEVGVHALSETALPAHLRHAALED